MRGLHANQKKIMDYLLDHKEGATLEELASHLEITNTAVKDHLTKIDTLGYLSYIDSKGLVGRPRRRYLLSVEGHDAFPKQYSWLSNVLLELLAEDLDKPGVAKLMRTLADKVAKTMESKFKNTKSQVEVLQLVTQALNDLGYRASLKQSDLRKGAVIEATNCVYHSVAKAHPELCNFDIRFIENTSGLQVRLEKCIARGDSVCRFCLSAPKGKL